MFGKDAENIAVTAALTETSVIQQTKTWLKKEGIRVEAFEQRGSTLVNARIADTVQRRDDTFIVKHLPANASGIELRERFGRYGELVKCTLAPSCTVGIVQYADKSHAQKAFNKLAFARYQNVPLYLEWAPGDVFDDVSPQETVGGASSSASKSDKLASGGKKSSAAGKLGEDENDIEEANLGCLFFKNLNFKTTEETLKAVFGRCKGFRSAIIMRKKAAVMAGEKRKENPGLSMGYGFLEFDTKTSAEEVLKQRQNHVVDEHALQLQISQRAAARGRKNSTTERNAHGKPLLSTRLCVRNLAFEVTKKELAQLFGAYGSISALRMPNKSDYTGHRGFGFVDFASKSEAAAAYEALQHTHLYGRRLVIEPAEDKTNDIDTVQEAAQKRQATGLKASESKKRRRAGVLEASGAGAGSFDDALI